MDYIQEYVKQCTAANFLVSNEPETPRFFHGMRMQMHEDTGQGWSEILCIHSGLYVQTADYCLKHRVETCSWDVQKPLEVGVMLSGRFEAQIPGRPKDVIASGDLWCVHGPFEQVLYTHHANENIRGVSICLPQDVIESWLGTSSCAMSSELEKLVLKQKALPLATGLHQSSELMRIARKIKYARRQTLADKLHFESLALDFLSQILTLNKPLTGSRVERTRRARTAVDEAVDILRQEWNNPPSISNLARRVNLNECYLKKRFRQQTGMSIGAYIRQLRMTKALEIIETGRYSILDTAIFVGYSNPGHFSAAFKKFYGHLPSYYLPRV